jgi:hypothetical protein
MEQLRSGLSSSVQHHQFSAYLRWLGNELQAVNRGAVHRYLQEQEERRSTEAAQQVPTA